MNNKNKGLTQIIPFSIGVSISVFFAFLLSVLVTYKLPQSDAGLFFLLNSFINLLVVLSTFGLHQYWIKFLTFPVLDKNKLIYDYLTIIISTIFWSICFFIFFYFSYQEILEEINFIYVILFISFLIGSIFFETLLIKLQVQLNFTLYGLLVSVPNLCRFFFSFFALMMLNNFFYLSLGQLVTTIFLLLLAFFLLNKKDWVDLGNNFNQLNFKDLFEHSIKFFQENYKFLLVNLIFVFHVQTPIIYSSYILNVEKIALLGVSYTLFLGFFFFPNLLIQRYLFPIMANTMKVKKSRSISYFLESLIILSIGYLILVLGFYLSEIIINTIFPVAYKESIVLFKIIIFALPLKLLVSYLVNICVLNDLTSYLNRALIFGLLINLLIFIMFFQIFTSIITFYSLIAFEVVFIFLILSIILNNRSKIS